ncbi:DNA mismatch repair protein MutS [Spirochaetia bacterium]|nr:DNA mismatch repair protein MutS [Spirochaetia bacterium]
MSSGESSPMLDQYRRIKRDHQGDVLFFRLGDFYEMFADDAVEVSALLNLTLTSRNGLPMCGLPYHAARSYIARLLKLGKKVAVCEQLSAPGKGIIERQVVEVITPGTTVDDDYLDKGSSNYLACFSAPGRPTPRSAGAFSFAYIDLSTGDFYATSFPWEDAVERLRQELERLQIKEMIVQESLLEEDSRIAAAILDRTGLVINRWADWLFDLENSRRRLEKQFGPSSLKGFGLAENSPELLSAGALLDYLEDTAKSLIPHVRSIVLYQDSEYVGIDESTQRNLELIHNLHDGDVRFSLLEVMDESRTAMGRRLLKWRILHPLRNIEDINKRLDMTETLYRNQEQLGLFREYLGKTPDLERLGARIAMDKAHGKDMLAVKNALDSFNKIEELTRKLSAKEHTKSTNYRGVKFSLCFESASARSLDIKDPGLMELRDLLARGLCDEPSILLTEGNLIRDGYNSRLDELHKLRDNGRQLLEAYLEEERNITGIPSLKIRYNRLIGYFFEVTRVHLSKVPSHFIRRQGIVGGERFTTDRLAELESEINGASDKIVDLEKQLFLELREKAKARLSGLAAAAHRIAEIDVAQSLARSATVRGWVRPVVDNENRLRIIEGRHPVVEAHLPPGEYIPNDIILSGEGTKETECGPPGETAPPAAMAAFALITGPNMAGKSTYLRSAALIAIMAQMGSFVSAREARIGLCDRIYCRVGASDNLARGESTFLVEMNETAYILHTATEQSLVIMDEVGRGTGTNDGLSIAWAVSEELLNRIKCRTLFATHYHELSHLSHPRLANRSMEVLDKDGEIIFLRKLKEGSAAESYGLHVARLAGLSDRVVERAGRIMEQLQERSRELYRSLPGASGGGGISGNRSPVESTYGACASLVSSGGEFQMSLIPETPPPPDALALAENADGVPAVKLDKFLADIAGLNPDNMTPMEALKKIQGWKAFFASVNSGRQGGKGNGLRRKQAPDETESPGLFD